MESLLVMTGPDAGGMDNELVRGAVNVLRTKADVQLARVALPGDLDGALHRRGSRPLVIVGGDRSLHAVVSALHRRMELDKAVVGMLPVGRSDFARTAGIPTDLEEAAHVVLAGAERRFDLILDCRGDVVVNAIHVGVRTRRPPGQDWRNRIGHLMAGVAGASGAAPRFGGGRIAHSFGYLADHALHSGGPVTRDRRTSHRRSKPLRIRIEADDAVVADFDQPVLSVDVNNGSSQDAELGRAGRSSSAPEADPCDGQVDVVVRFAVDRLTRVRRSLRRPQGGVATDAAPDTITVRAQQVRVAGQRFWMNADGSSGGYEQRCTWKVAPHRLRMIVPA